MTCREPDLKEILQTLCKREPTRDPRRWMRWKRWIHGNRAAKLLIIDASENDGRHSYELRTSRPAPRRSLVLGNAGEPNGRDAPPIQTGSSVRRAAARRRRQILIRGGVRDSGGMTPQQFKTELRKTRERRKRYRVLAQAALELEQRGDMETAKRVWIIAKEILALAESRW